MKAESKTEAGQVDLAEPDAAGGRLDIAADQKGQAVGEAEFGAGREVEGCEQVAGLIGIGNLLIEKVPGVVKIEVIAAVLPVKEIGGSTDTEIKEGIIAGDEVPAEIDRDLEHGECPLYVFDAAAHSHAIIAPVTIRDMVVLWKCGEVFPGVEESGADIQVIDELIIDRDADGAAGAIAGKGINGGVVGAADDAQYEGAVDMETAFIMYGLAEGAQVECAEGGVVDPADAGLADAAANSRERQVMGAAGDGGSGISGIRGPGGHGWVTGGIRRRAGGGCIYDGVVAGGLIRV